METEYFQHERQNIYIACEELNFIWDERDIKEFRHMWDEGLALIDIARAFSREPAEVAFLVIDLAEKGKINPRPGGIWGRRMA